MVFNYLSARRGIDHAAWANASRSNVQPPVVAAGLLVEIGGIEGDVESWSKGTCNCICIPVFQV
jgi:hypothetical protein